MDQMDHLANYNDNDISSRSSNNTTTTTDQSSIRITRGTPQGSLISPILFNLYIDDLLKALDEDGKTQHKTYADDLAFLAKCLRDVFTALWIILNWCLENSMEVNWQKTKILRLHARSSPLNTLDTALKIPKRDGSGGIEEGELSFVSSYKYLGVIIDKRLTLKEYTDQVKRRLKAFLGSIPKIQIKLMSVKSRLHLWKTYAFSHLNYGCSILALHPTAMNRFAKTYRRSLTIALNLNKSTAKDKLSWATGVWSPELSVSYHFLRVTAKLEMTYGLASLPKNIQETKQRLLKELGITEVDVSSPKTLSHKFRKIFNLKTYGHESVEPYKFSVKAASSDYYLVKFWSGEMLDLSKYARSKKYNNNNNNLGKERPKCKRGKLGDQEHFLDHCELLATLRKKLRSNGLVKDDRTLYKQVFDIRIRLPRVHLKDYLMLVHLFGNFLEESNRLVKEFLFNNCSQK